MGSKEVTLKIMGDSTSAERALDSVAKKTNQLGKSGASSGNTFSSMTKSVGQVMVGLNAYAAAAKAVVGVINGTTEAYEKQRKAELSLEVASRNNPYLDASSVQKLKDYAG